MPVIVLSNKIKNGRLFLHRSFLIQCLDDIEMNDDIDVQSKLTLLRKILDTNCFEAIEKRLDLINLLDNEFLQTLKRRSTILPVCGSLPVIGGFAYGIDLNS